MENIVFENVTRITTEDGKTYIEADVGGVSMVIPESSSNRHYAEILRQVEAGTLTIADAE